MRPRTSYSVASAAVVDVELRGRARVIEQAVEQADARVLFLHQRWPSTWPSARARSERIVSTNSECAPLNEWMNPPVGQARPAPRLHRAADLQRQLVEARLPRARLDPPFAREPPQVAVGADVVEPVVVHPHVGQVRRHPFQRARAAEVEELLVAGRVELEQRGAELEPLRPLGPAARLVAPFDGEDGRAVLRAPGVFDREDLAGGDVEERADPRQADPQARGGGLSAWTAAGIW